MNKEVVLALHGKNNFLEVSKNAADADTDLKIIFARPLK